MNRKLLLFVVFTFVFVSGLFFLQESLKIDYQIISLTQFAPTIAYFVIIIIFKDLLIPINFKINKIIIVKLTFVIIIPLFISLLNFTICNILKLDFNINSNISSLKMVLFGIVIGAIGEEIGWRGFLQPSLDKKYPKIISCIIVGIIWGTWHIPYFFYGPIYIISFIIFTISYSVVIVLLLKNTQYNIVLSSVFHISLNMGAWIFFNINTENHNLTISIVNSIIWLISAGIIVLVNKKYYFDKSGKTSA